MEFPLFWQEPARRSEPHTGRHVRQAAVQRGIRERKLKKPLEGLMEAEKRIMTEIALEDIRAHHGGYD